MAYVLDTNILSDLARVARENPDDLDVLLAANYFKDADLIIPSTIIIESGRSENMTIQHFEDFYKEIFIKLSNIMKIFIVTTEEAHRILNDSIVTSKPELAFKTIKQLAIGLNKMNLDVKDQLHLAGSIVEIDEALNLFSNDAGERQVNLIGCILLQYGLKCVLLISNDEAGVYVVRKVVSRDTAFLNLFGVSSTDQFLQIYQLMSLDKMFGEVLQTNQTWTYEDKFAFLKRNRKNQKRKPRYFVTNHDVEHEVLSNKEFVQVFHGNPTAKIAY